jgi:hypothetical protein
MHLHLSPHDGVPIYLQIVNLVNYLVTARQRELAMQPDSQRK